MQKIKHISPLPIIFWRERVMNMNDRTFYIAGGSEALNFAAGELAMRGLNVADAPSPDVTHLLLGVPCKESEQQLTGLLKQLGTGVKVFGGFLSRNELENYRCFDLLSDELYLAQNARITAYCALQVAQERLKVTWDGCPVLITGGGRIAQCLAGLLKGLGAEVVVAVRREAQQTMFTALGYEGERLGFPDYILGRFRVIFNTVPAPILSAQALKRCRPGCLKIELASTNGLEGEDIIIARGLPGVWAPESSGRLIARTVLRLCAQKEGQK